MLKKKRLYINEDNAHFYIKHPVEDMSVDGLNNLVDTYNKCNSLQGIFFNINVQRALFDSREWEAIYHDYNPENGADQPCLQWLPPEKRELHLNCHGRNWIHNFWINSNAVDNQLIVDTPKLVLPDVVTTTVAWSIPLELLQDDTNIVEVLPPQVVGNLVWTEITINFN